MLKSNTKISTLALACLLLGASSCSRGDDFQSGGKLLKVNVQMATSSLTPMLARGVTTSPIISDTMDLGNDLVLVASSQPRDYEPEEALTRGTPIRNAANLPSMNVKVYNSGTGAFSGSTALTATLKGTNSSGAWSLSPSYKLEDGEQNTYMAYCPIESGSNGIVVEANERTLTYTAPTTVANQPDLCSATIIKDDVSGYLPLAMQHRLTAVGIKVSADNVKIHEISMLHVKSRGTLNLETGTWSNLGWTVFMSPILTTTTPGTSGAMNDITAPNGYLMLPPQTFEDNIPELYLRYTYDGGTQQMVRYKLKDLTGGKWEAGQIVMYEIQLKAKFLISFTPASLTVGANAGSASFSYSTNSPSATDPQVSFDEARWIRNLMTSRINKLITINYDASTLTSDRTAVIKVTSGFRTVDYSFTQKAMPVVNISESNWSAGSGIGGQTKTITVTTNGCRWKIVDPGKDGNWSRVALSRTEGASGESVTITLKGNPQKATRSFNVRFEAVKATNDTPYVYKELNVQQNKIAQHEVSNAHTAFAPSGLLKMDNDANWMAKQEHDLFDDRSKEYPETGGLWSSYDDGFANTNKGWAHIPATAYCRSLFGNRAFLPAKNELPLWANEYTPVSGYQLKWYHTAKSISYYVSSTYTHKAGDSWNYWLIQLQNSSTKNATWLNKQIGDYPRLYHRCFYKQNP